jgi:molybdopterin converting factor subunit 1
VRVHVLYFAMIRERLRRESEDVDLVAGATVADLLDHLAAHHAPVAAMRPFLRVARNQQGAEGDQVLTDGDEVALIPPVSGGSGPARAPLCAVRDAPLDVGEALAAVTHEGAGGIVTFTGLVRRQSRGRTVERLEYEAYRGMAEARLVEIAADLEQRHGARLCIVHRVGNLVVGDLAVVIAASAPHRAEAFAACREAIERLKQEVPIWKKEIGEDGEEWIGLGP